MKECKNNITQFIDCSFCCACYNKCPTNAISISDDSIYYSLKVDNNKCVNCGKCLEVCPVNNDFRTFHNAINSYAAFSNNDSVMNASSSGGAFHEIASYVLEKGGLVWGAAYSDDYKKVLMLSTDAVELTKLQKSKYVESYIGDAFERIESTLKIGRLVLFCGSPCQVAGLNAYLGRDYNNLITCDFTCGGFPSHKIYRDHINYLEHKYRSKTISVDFRPKIYGWKIYSLLLQFQNGKVYSKSALFDSYFYQFIHAKNNIRDYCYKCKFSNKHYSDFTLADLWKQPSDECVGFNDNGTSLIVTNTLKAEQLFDLIKDRFQIAHLSEEDGLYNIKPTDYPDSKIQEHESFICDYEKYGELIAHKKHNSSPLITRIKHFINISLRFKL